MKSSFDSTQPDWMDRPERGSPRLLSLMGWLSRRCGRRFGRVLLLPIAAWFWARTPLARADSARYLSRVYGRPAGARDTFAHYHHFAQTILDRMFLLADRRELFEVQVIGREYLLDHLDKGKGVFMVGAHMGSFEALRVMARDHACGRVSMAMYEGNARKIGAWLRSLDPTLEEMIVPLGRVDSMLQIQARLNRGDMVGFLADRSFGHDPVVMAPFLGDPAPFPTGIFRMAAVLRCPVVVMAGLYVGGNRYQLHFAPLADFSQIGRSARARAVQEAVFRFAATLETFCRIAPLNWFNFFDFWSTGRKSPGLATNPERSPLTERDPLTAQSGASQAAGQPRASTQDTGESRGQHASA